MISEEFVGWLSDVGYRETARRMTSAGFPIRYQSIQYWVESEDGIPAKWIKPVEQVTSIRRELLRPELYD